MAKRGRKKKFKLKVNISPETIRSVVALVLITAAIVSLISFFAPNYTLNRKIQDFLTGILGWTSIVFPIIIGLSGLLFIQKFKTKLKEPRLVVGFTVLVLSAAGLFEVFASERDAGGIIGELLTDTLKNLISIYGAAAVLLITLFISLLIVFDISLEQVIEFISSKTGGLLALKNALKNRKKNKGIDDEDSTFEITPSVTSVENFLSDKVEEPEVSAKQSKKDAKVEGPSFEIIDPPREPKGSMPDPAMGDSYPDSAISPSLPYSDRIWENPPLSLLDVPSNTKPDVGDVEARAKIIKDTLRSFGIDATVVDIKPGPSVTQYSLSTRSGTKVSKVANLHNDLAMALASRTGTVRIEAPIPGKSLIGIEVPNNSREMVHFRSLYVSEAMKNMKSKLGIVLGMDVAGRTHVYDIGKMPHLLIAGATGSGKSIFIHNILFSLLYNASPQEVKLIIIDPKRVELSHYQDIPHLLTPVVTDMDKAPSVFSWAVAEMERRYKLLEQAKARNIDSYNEKSGFQALPYIVIVVDELAEIMARDPAGVEKSIIRIAQLARATGIHLVLAVQRPSTNIITGLIKANIPSRVAFSVASQVDSRVIIDQPGAEKLLGKGDMLFIPPDAPKPTRLQAPNISDKEISNLMDYLKNQGLPPDYKDEVLEMSPTGKSGGSSGSSDWGDDVDELFDDAVELVVSADKASASLLQRKLSIGYARAARIIDQMEEKNIIGPSQSGSKARDILYTRTAKDPLDSIDLSEDEPISSLSE